MREIDPQSDPRLTKALQHLAASSPRSAPSELGAGLLGEFRRHHARRRRVRRISIAGLAACLILTVVLLSVRRPSSRVQNAQNTATPTKSVQAPEKSAVAPPVPIVSAVPHVSHRKVAKNTKTSVSVDSRAFVALPGYDRTVPLDELHVVRVQLPASALWQIGAPVSASVGTHNVTADFVVSQGGTPYAVRLVQ